MTQPKIPEIRESGYRMRVSQAGQTSTGNRVDHPSIEELTRWLDSNFAMRQEGLKGITVIEVANPPVEYQNLEPLRLPRYQHRDPEYVVVEKPRSFQGQAGGISPVHLDEGERLDHLRLYLGPPIVSRPNLTFPSEARLFDATGVPAHEADISDVLLPQEQSVASQVTADTVGVKDDYVRHLQRTHRIATVVFMVASLVMYLAAADTILFLKDGGSILHPILSMLLGLASAGLVLTAAVSLRTTMRYFLKVVKGN